MDLTHVARDHKNFVSLKFHERGWRNKSVHRHRAPIDPAEDVVHLFDPWNAFKRNAGIEQSLEIDFVGVFLQEKNVLAIDKTPVGVNDRRILFVSMVDRNWLFMFRLR